MKQTIAIYVSLLSAAVLCSTVQTSFAQDDEVPEIRDIEPEAPLTTAPPEPSNAQFQDIIADLQQQIQQLKAQVEELSRSKARAVSPEGTLVDSLFASAGRKNKEKTKSKASIAKSESSTNSFFGSQLLIEGSDGERIAIDADGILTIAGPEGETIRVDTKSGIAKAIGGIIEKSLEAAAKEMERELEDNIEN